MREMILSKLNEIESRENVRILPAMESGSRACRWILDRGTPPPMLFSELMEAELDPALLPEVTRLLDCKRNAPEVKTIPRIESLNRYLEDSIEELRSRILRLPEDPGRGWEELDRLFLSQLE